MKKLSKQTSIIYNQLWITKAIEEGHMDFLPIHKLPGKSIGEHIEIKYNQLYNEEFDRHRYNGTLNDYERLIANEQKITKKNSLLFTREWIKKAKEDGHHIPRKIGNFSIGEILELQYSEREILMSNPDLNKIFELSGEKHKQKELKK